MPFFFLPSWFLPWAAKWYNGENIHIMGQADPGFKSQFHHLAVVWPYKFSNYFLLSFHPLKNEGDGCDSIYLKGFEAKGKS